MTLQVLFQNRKPNRVATLDEYRASGGYEALADALRRRTPSEICQAVLDSNLQGRGGAGFPTGRKWMGVPERAPFPRYIISNIDEMEPGTFKDRMMTHIDPHMIIEGMALSGYAVSAERGIVFVRPAYESTARIFEREVRIAREAGFLGRNLFGSGFSFDIVVHRSGGRYICGEGTAQINAIEGLRPHPKQTPIRSTEKGLWNLPTVLDNLETLVNVPHIVRHGPEWFKGLARTKTASGTKLYCVSGKVNRPGCYELPMGTRLSEIIDDHGGGMLPGSEFKTCLPGGASTRFLEKKDYDVEMDFESTKKAGNRLGTGAVIVFDSATCLVGATLNLIDFFVRESCGFCTPCREGLPFIRDLLHRIEEGDGEEGFVPMLKGMAAHLWKSYCAFAPGAVMPLQSLLEAFPGEVHEHISQKRCPYRPRPG
jgi:NADH-quinone oxidoreductase subunit F